MRRASLASGSSVGDMVATMDKLVGRILHQLDESGVRENTLVIFTGDNGTDTPVVSMMGDRRVAGAKGKTIDAGCRVPLIVQWKGKASAGQVSQDLIDFSDFLPTLCEAAGAKVPVSLKLDGRSFLPQLMGERGDPREWIYIWYSRNGGPIGKEFTRNERYKLYRTGEFFDVPHDYLEKNPLDNAKLTAEQKAVRAQLQAALDQYADARPERFAKWNERKKQENAKP